MIKIAVILLGPQGSGKGTQAQFLSKKLKAPVIDMGDLLRKEAESATQDGVKVKKYIENGWLIPEELAHKLIQKKISQLASRPWLIVDGYPRTLDQKKLADKMFGGFGFKKVVVAYIKLDDETAIARMIKRGRKDDRKTIIVRRLKKYHQETDRVISAYRQEGKAVEIDGRPSTDAVSNALWNKIHGLLTK